MSDKVYMLFPKNLLKNPCIKCKSKVEGIYGCDMKDHCHELEYYEIQQEMLKKGKLIDIDILLVELNKIIRNNIVKVESKLNRRLS
jgi:hypothetical protein